MFSNIKRGCLRGIHVGSPFLCRKKPRLSTRDAGVFTQQSKCKRVRDEDDCIRFFLYTGFLTLPRFVRLCCQSEIDAERTAWSKLTKLKPQVKIQRCRLLTVVFTFFLIFFNQHIVDSVFMCMFGEQSKTHNNEKAIHTNRKCVLLDCHIDNRRHRHHNIDVDIRAR